VLARCGARVRADLRAACGRSGHHDTRAPFPATSILCPQVRTQWHLGNFWTKNGDPRKTRADELWPASHPGMHGFDQWHATEASAESSTPNCGCDPAWNAQGDGCIVGGGFWTKTQSLECTNYWGPSAGGAGSAACFNASAVGRDCVQNLTTKIPGDDTEHILDRFQGFLEAREAAGDSRPFVAMLWLHTNHVPHYALPEFYHAYNDSLGNPAGDYLGTITQMDSQVERYRSLLRRFGAAADTLTWFSADNGAHTAGRSGGQLSASQGLRQCKASLFDGGIRQPGFIHWPAGITSHQVVRHAASTLDVLATVQDLVGPGASHNPNPSWAQDGVSLAPLLAGNTSALAPRASLLPFALAGQWAVINQTGGATWKLVVRPQRGQCPDFLPPFGRDAHPCATGCLFELDSDPSESDDRCSSSPTMCASMRAAVAAFRASVDNSRANETGCGASQPRPADAFRLSLLNDASTCLTLAAPGTGAAAAGPRPVRSLHELPRLGPCASASSWRAEPATGFIAAAARVDVCLKSEAENFPVCGAGTPVWTGRCGIGAGGDPDLRLDASTGRLRPVACPGMCVSASLVLEPCGPASARFQALPGP